MDCDAPVDRRLIYLLLVAPDVVSHAHRPSDDVDRGAA